MKAEDDLENGVAKLDAAIAFLDAAANQKTLGQCARNV